MQMLVAELWRFFKYQRLVFVHVHCRPIVFLETLCWKRISVEKQSVLCGRVIKVILDVFSCRCYNVQLVKRRKFKEKQPFTRSRRS